MVETGLEILLVLHGRDRARNITCPPWRRQGYKYYCSSKLETGETGLEILLVLHDGETAKNITNPLVLERQGLVNCRLKSFGLLAK